MFSFLARNSETKVRTENFVKNIECLFVHLRILWTIFPCLISYEYWILYISRFLELICHVFFGVIITHFCYNTSISTCWPRSYPAAMAWQVSRQTPILVWSSTRSIMSLKKTESSESGSTTYNSLNSYVPNPDQIIPKGRLRNKIRIQV